MKDMLGHEAAVDSQGTEHNGVHEHPADERWCCAFVETAYAFIFDGLRNTLKRAAKPTFVGSLQTNFYGVKGVADCDSG